MPTFFQRPENALKRANELIAVGKKDRALDALYDVIKSKKHRTWQKIHEPIMAKYLTLCVELKKSHIAKEGLYQYKNICQQVNIKSLEDVVRKYLALAEEKTEAARQESHQSVVDIDDLDVIQTPENLLLSAVSGEDQQDRADRAILTPWVKFLWESYRQSLDLLRNNSSVEKLYQDIAQQAFKFCLNYTRKTEFRKLCDNLRIHLGHIHKHQHQQRAINLNNPESQAMHLETRLVQLDSAIQMELWQEAFKAVEDIHGLIQLSKKPKPQLMANYYQKLGLVFWKSGNHLFHACAWHRLFHLSKEQKKNISQDELQRLGSRVLCATLAIPIPPSRNQIDRVLGLDDNSAEKTRRLATLLGLQNPPTRAGLVKDLLKYNVVQCVHPELQNLYQWLEVEFHPLQLSRRITAPLDFISDKEDLSQYISALQDITLTRLLQQVSQLYETMEFERLASLAPFASKFYLERMIVNAAKNLDLQVRIDHRTRSLSFGRDLATQKDDVPEGPFLQSMPSKEIRNQLSSMAQALEKAVIAISPPDTKNKRDDLRSLIINTYRNVMKKEHLRILQRRQIIEDRKEELENMNVQREKEEIEQQEEQKRKHLEAEMARLEREAEEREKQRQIEERKEIQKKVAKERLEQLKSTALGARAFADLNEDEIAEMDVDDILAKQVEQLEKEKRELQEKLKSQEKKIDYFERAKRIEEIPLLEEAYEADRIKSREFWESLETDRIQQLVTERETALEHRERLAHITKDKDDFLKKLNDARVSVYKDKLVEFEKKLVEERKKRLEERKQRRKEERRQKWLNAKEEEEQRRRDEELKRQREEDERRAVELREKEEAEHRERMQKLKEIEEKKRAKEREIEEREKMRREEELPSRRIVRDERIRGEGDTWRRPVHEPEKEADSTTNAWRAHPKEGGWRERQKIKEQSWTKSPVDEDRDEDTSAEPKAERTNDWADVPPPPVKEERSWSDRIGMPKDVRDGDFRDPPRDRPPPRDRESYRPPRDFGDRTEPRDRDFRDGPPRRDRDFRDAPPRGDRDIRDAPRRGDDFRDRDRGGPRDFRDRRGDDRDFRDVRGDRDFRDRRGDDRDDFRSRPPARDDRGGSRDGWRDRGGDDRDRGSSWRGGAREEGRGWRDRDLDSRDDGPPSREGWRDKGGPPEREWRRRSPPPSDREDRGAWRDRPKPRDERPPLRDERPPPRDERPPPRDEPSWRGGRDERTSPPKEDAWKRRERKPSPDRDMDRKPRREPEPAATNEEAEDDGWTTVAGRR